MPRTRKSSSARFSLATSARRRVAQAPTSRSSLFRPTSTVASRGVYLLSFLVENYVDRIVDYAASQGKKSFAALTPKNDYANVAVGEFQRRGQARVARRVDRALHARRVRASVAKVAALGSQIDALLIPEQAGGHAGRGAGAGRRRDRFKVQILGTGLWNDARVLGLPALARRLVRRAGERGFNAFAQRYRAKYGSDPTRMATFAYDAVSLAAALARTQGAPPTARSADQPSGFNGADGVFRFRPNGRNERGLAVVQINNGAPPS